MDCEPAFVRRSSPRASVGLSCAREIDAKASAGVRTLRERLFEGLDAQELQLETAARCLQAMRSVICGKKCSPTAAAYFAATAA